MKQLHHHSTSSTLAAIAFGALAATTFAGERRFTYTYEATTAPVGTVEFEQWVTWKARRGTGGNANQFDFRHELEFALTDRLQLGLYLSDWSVTHRNGRTDADWKNVGVEAIWNLTNPTTDWLGSALYGEVKLGDELFVLEGKLILQKNFGPWIVAYNATLEAEWEGPGYDEEVGEFKQSAGVSYQISPRLTVGAEAFHEVEFEDWRHTGEHAFYVGPNVSVRSGAWFATATVLFQTTGIDSEPDVQSRLIFGFHF
jgi:hypothetical protein